MKKYLALALLLGCTSLEEAHKKKVKRNNEVTEAVTRHSSEHRLVINPIERKEHHPYPWEEQYIGSIRKITKEFFRCKGKSENPPAIVSGNPPVYFYDCTPHTLPIREGKERVSELLIDVLNYVQQEMKARVVISSGHRCPTHQKFVLRDKRSRMSRYLVGAKVDFYVEGHENEIEAVKAVVERYFTTPVARKNVEIQLFGAREGRSSDNDHSHAYLSIDDLTIKDSWEEAYHGFTVY